MEDGRWNLGFSAITLQSPASERIINRMKKLPMYTILAITMGIGSYLPVMFGQSMLGGWSIIGTVLGGVIGIMIYAKLRNEGYIE